MAIQWSWNSFEWETGSALKEQLVRTNSLHTLGNCSLWSPEQKQERLRGRSLKGLG